MFFYTCRVFKLTLYSVEEQLSICRVEENFARTRKCFFPLLRGCYLCICVSSGGLKKFVSPLNMWKCERWISNWLNCCRIFDMILNNKWMLQYFFLHFHNNQPHNRMIQFRIKYEWDDKNENIFSITISWNFLQLKFLDNIEKIKNIEKKAGIVRTFKQSAAPFVTFRIYLNIFQCFESSVHETMVCYCYSIMRLIELEQNKKQILFP